MGVSFKVSNDNQTMVLTPSGIAFIKQEELKIYNGHGDDVYKGTMINQLYMLHGVDQGTYEKRGWREANNDHTKEERPSVTPSQSEHSARDFFLTIAIFGVGLFCVYIYQVILHPIYKFLFN